MHIALHVQLKGFLNQVPGINKLAIVCLEPLAGSAPKFPTSATDNLIFPMKSELSLSCAAQGYPLPQFR